MKIVLLVCVLISASYAADECCLPDQLEGEVGFVEGLVQNGKPSLVEGIVAFSMDYKIGKYFANTTVVMDAKPSHMLIYIDFSKDPAHQYIVKDKKCSKTPTEPPFQCVPETAVDRGSFRMGIDPNLKVTSYAFNIQGQGVSLSVTQHEKSCIPIGETIIGRVGEVSYVNTMGFMNPKVGISNPDVFNLPDICKNGKVHQLKSHEYARIITGF